MEKQKYHSPRNRGATIAKKEMFQDTDLRQAAVVCSNLTKKYGSVTAIEGIDCVIDTNTLFGIIGPDGAGKSSWLRILSTLTNPTSGKAVVLGKDVVTDYKPLRKVIGYMPSKFSLYGDLSVEENLKFFASVYKTSVEENYAFISDIYQLLAPFAKRPAGKLSGGMKQKLALCCALIHRPKLLILDEPTTGVDPVSRREFWQILSHLRDTQAMTIVVSTPYMDEAILCNRVVLMNRGRILKEDQPQAMVASFGQTLWAAKATDMGKLLKALKETRGVTGCYAFGETNHFTIDSSLLSIETLKDKLKEKGLQALTIKEIEPGIEDYYLWASERVSLERVPS